MSKKEIIIKYLGETPVEVPSSYEDFIKLIVSTFFITDKMKQSMSIIYFDDENYENILYPDNYSDAIEEAKEFVIQFQEEESQSKPVVNSSNVETLQNKVIEKMKSVEDDINEYKQKLVESCKKAVEKKLEEVDKQHQEEIKQLIDFYEKKLNNIKNRVNEETQTIVNDIQNKSTTSMTEQLDQYKRDIEKEMESLIKEKIKYMETIEGEINFSELEKKQKEVGQVVDNNKQILEKNK
jgi:hypothetical protein